MIGQQIREERVRLALSRRHLAQLAGVTRVQLQRLEDDGNVTLETVKKVLAHLPALEYRLVSARVPEVAGTILQAAGELVRMLQSDRQEVAGAVAAPGVEAGPADAERLDAEARAHVIQTEMLLRKQRRGRA